MNANKKRGELEKFNLYYEDLPREDFRRLPESGVLVGYIIPRLSVFIRYISQLFKVVGRGFSNLAQSVADIIDG